MTDREKEYREKVRKECWSAESNFQGIDYLMRMENDWKVAERENDYSFESCPNNFDCLEDFVGLCERDGVDNDSMNYYEKVEQCENCWKLALRGE